MHIVKTLQNEGSNIRCRAEIVENNDGSYLVRYYNSVGSVPSVEYFNGKTLEYVTNCAENWLSNMMFLRD